MKFFSTRMWHRPFAIFLVAFLFTAGLLSQERDTSGEKKVLRAHLLSLGAYLFSTINYWGEGAKWAEDIDFRLSFSDQKRRLFSPSSYRFDSNRFKTNWQHAFSGAAYYNIYRTNGYSFLKSLEYSVYLSLLWEYVSEYQEVISINDMIYNTLGAVTAGENLFMMGAYLHQKDQIGLNILGCLLNPVNALNRLLDGSSKTKLFPLAPALNHAASLRLTWSRGDLLPLAGQQVFMNARLAIDLFPSPSDPGSFHSPLNWQPSFLFGHFSLSVTGNRFGFNEFRLLTRNTLLGWLARNRSESGTESVLAIGFGNMLDLYRKKAVDPFDTSAAQLSWEPDRVIDHPVHYTDKFSSLGLLGTSLLWQVRKDRMQFTLEAGCSLNFALINSLPFNALSRERTISGTKATLLYYGYYYGLGVGGHVRGDLVWSPFRLFLSYDQQRYDSIEGLDRFQNKMTWDPHLADSRSFLEISIYILPIRGIQLGLVYERLGRWGRIEAFGLKEKEERLSLSLAHHF
jgi:hypothetical protein